MIEIRLPDAGQSPGLVKVGCGREQYSSLTVEIRAVEVDNDRRR
jgi:hypothetical protein